MTVIEPWWACRYAHNYWGNEKKIGFDNHVFSLHQYFKYRNKQMKNVFSAKILLIKQGFAYTITNGFVSFIAFLVIPLFTRKLTLADYGIAGIYLAVANIVNTSLDHRFLVHKSYIQRNDKNFINQTISACVLIYSDQYFLISTISVLAAIIYIFITIALLKQYSGLGGAMGLAAGHGVWMVFMMISTFYVLYVKRKK